MTELGLGFIFQVGVDLGPGAVVIHDALAGGAEGKNTPHLPDLCQGALQHLIDLAQ